MDILLILIIVGILFILFNYCFRRDERGFDRNEIHKSGTKYDEDGFDVDGYDKNGYNEDGYNIHGKNAKGKYNRIYDVADYKDSEYNQDGFLDPRIYTIGATTHARDRITERMTGKCAANVDKVVYDAYCFGRSARQIKKTSAALVKDIENRHESGIVLIYNGFIYVFSEENVLITMYKNENIPL